MPVGLEQNFAFMESQAAYIESQARMIQHGSIQYPDLVGISREASPHADSIVYYTYNGSGSMVDIANRGTDYPFVEVQQAQHTVPIHWKALAYDYSDREIGRAMLLGLPLTDRKVRIAFRIAEEEKERVVLNGDAAKGWDGLINQPTTVVGHSPAAGRTAWASATDEQIFNDLNDAIAGVWVETTQVRTADTVLLPPAQYSLLQRPMGTNANRSIMNYVMENNILTATTGRPLMFRTVRQLNGAAASNADRMIVYARDMEVVRFHVPQELMFSEPQRSGLGWVYFGSMVLGGVEIMEPKSFRYVDGV